MNFIEHSDLNLRIFENEFLHTTKKCVQNVFPVLGNAIIISAFAEAVRDGLCTHRPGINHVINRPFRPAAALTAYSANPAAFFPGPPFPESAGARREAEDALAACGNTPGSCGGEEQARAQ